MVFTIIIPSFRQPHELKNALHSINLQTYKDYEVLVMDGESGDETAEIVAQFTNPNIKFCSSKDKGIYDAMNKGINISRGDYLYFMGCDDRFESDMVLEKVFNIINTYNEDFIYGNVIFTKDGSIYDGKFGELKLLDKNICHQAIFIKRKIFNKLGNFSLKYKYLADWEFNMKCFATKSVSIRYIPDIIAYYNNDGSSYNNKDIAFFDDREMNKKLYFSFLIRYLDSHRNRFYKYLINYL